MVRRRAAVDGRHDGRREGGVRRPQREIAKGVEMTSDELRDMFEFFNDEFLHYERIEPSRLISSRRDLCAFMMLDAGVPFHEGDRDIVGAAQHDEIFLGVSLEELSAKATPDLIRDLVRCGVRYDETVDSLAMFA